MPRAFKRLDQLPARIQSKIVTPLQERSDCWIWTGAISPRRHRQRHRAVRPDTTEAAMPTMIANDRAVPVVHDRLRGSPVAAHRKLFMLCAEIENWADVPRLERCQNERCVSPWHAYPIGRVERTRASRPPDLTWPREAVLRRLQQIRPAPFLAAENLNPVHTECGLPPGTVTPELWAEYLAWDEATPDDD